MRRPSQPLLPVGTVPLTSDARLSVRGVEDPTKDRRLVLDIRLERRSPVDLSGSAFCATAAGFRLPLYADELLADEIRTVAKRASETALFAPLTEGEL